MIAFMLHHPGMKAARRALDDFAVQTEAAIADMGGPLDHSRAGPAPRGSLPSRLPVSSPTISISGLIRTVRGAVWSKRSSSDRPGIAALVRGLEHHHPQRHMDLGRGQAGAVGVDHGLDHVSDQTADFGRCRVGDGLGRAGPGRDGPCGRF